MTTTQRALNEMVKTNLSINGTAKLAHPVTVTLKCWNGWNDAPRTFELTDVVRMGKAGLVHFSDQFVFLRISELSDADCKALQGAMQSTQKIYAIKDDETDSWHGEFPSIRAAINFIHKCYADRKMSIWRYEGGTKYTRVIYK